VKLGDLQTPALCADAAALDENLRVMAEALPGARMRPHVKAHKCTSLAQRQAELGHRGFTCATIREMEGMAAAGLGEDLLLANEVLDASRLGALAAAGARVTVAVDSDVTLEAAARGGVREVLIDVNVGMPRCGCPPQRAGALAEAARRAGLQVRGVMGYEGHAMPFSDAEKRSEITEASMRILLAAHAEVGGDVISAGGTCTYAINRWATEIQAGSYALMDATFTYPDLPFRPALFVLGTVISVAEAYAVSDTGLKALAMDHGQPEIEAAKVLFYSDEHATFVPEHPLQVGDRVRVLPSHVDPTIAKHEDLHLLDGDQVLETWPINLRGW
jgi:D-serine deaminase-like pyridoxal phosphate-dependent protein